MVGVEEEEAVSDRGGARVGKAEVVEGEVERPPRTGERLLISLRSFCVLVLVLVLVLVPSVFWKLSLKGLGVGGGVCG